MSIKKGKKYLVEKRNVLNEMRASHLNLQEVRFLSIYMARINARDPSTREVTFPLDDFRKILDLGKLNHKNIKNAIDSLLQKIVHLPDGNGGYSAFQLFKECKLFREVDKTGVECWFVTIDAHDKSLPLMFDFKREYFTYELWNALRLGSFNQIRMYEILKQYENVGERIISIQELRELLSIDKNSYEQYREFKKFVLEPCKLALEKNTDIRYTYEVHQRGARGKILSLNFTIEKNKNHADPLSLSAYLSVRELAEAVGTPAIPATGTVIDEDPSKEYENDYILSLRSACDDKLEVLSIVTLNDEMQIFSEYLDLTTEEERYHFLRSVYHEMLEKKSRGKPILDPAGYMKGIIRNKGLQSKEEFERINSRRRSSVVLG